MASPVNFQKINPSPFRLGDDDDNNRGLSALNPHNNEGSGGAQAMTRNDFAGHDTGENGPVQFGSDNQCCSIS
jgi:hypothetical protein